jgi:hypothetical protein
VVTGAGVLIVTDDLATGIDAGGNGAFVSCGQRVIEGEVGREDAATWIKKEAVAAAASIHVISNDLARVAVRSQGIVESSVHAAAC